MTDQRAEGATARTRDLLRHRPLRLLLLADLTDGAGTWAFATVFSLVVFDRTGSAAWISIAIALRWIPALVLGSFAGVLADRYPRGRLMIGSAAGSGVLMGLLALGVEVDAPLAVLLTLSAVQAAVSTVYTPAFGAALPDIVPERLLAGANGLREIVANTAVLGGPAVGILFLLAGDPALGIAFNALSFVVPVAVQLYLRVDSRGAGESGANPLVEVLDGIRALRAQRTAAVLFVTVVLDSGIAAINTSLALPIAGYVGSDADDYGYLLIGSAVGAILAAGLAGRLAARPRLALVIVGALLAQAVPFALIVAVPHPVAAFVLMLVSGMGMIVVDIAAITALQRDVPGEYLGRVFGLLQTGVLGASLVFAVLGGSLVGWAGMTPTLLILGLGTSAIVLACLPVLLATDRANAGRAEALDPVVTLLGSLDLFDGADRPVLERLALAAVAEDVPAGTVLIREGDPAEEIWLLADGRLDVTSRATGTLPAVDAPGYVGEIGVLHERARTATVTTATGCRVHRLAAQDFRDALSGRTASSSLLLVSGQRLARTDRRRPMPHRPRPYSDA